MTNPLSFAKLFSCGKNLDPVPQLKSLAMMVCMASDRTIRASRTLQHSIYSTRLSASP